MHVKMTDGKNTIEWVLSPAIPLVKQIDKTGTHWLPFMNADLACAWIVAQVNYVRAEMPEYKFTYL